MKNISILILLCFILISCGEKIEDTKETNIKPVQNLPELQSSDFGGGGTPTNEANTRD